MRALIAALCAARAATLRPLRPLQSPRDASLRALASDDLCERLKERVDLCSHVPEGLELLPLLGDGVGGLPDGTRLGAVAAPLAAALADAGDAFVVGGGAVRLAPALRGAPAAARTAAVAAVTAELRARGVVEGWRDELLAVVPAYGDEPAFLVERAAYPLLGCKGYGVHVNGFAVSRGELRLWVGTRSATKQTFPGMLDHICAGQQPHDLAPGENVVKEAGEEAGIPEEIARRAKSVGVCSYRGVDEWGQLKNDVLFCYDLELPWDFEPIAVDGEVEGFERWDLDRVAAAVATGANNAIGEFTSYKPNCNLVVIDFLVRIGWLSADAPGYLQLVDELRQGDCR